MFHVNATWSRQKLSSWNSPAAASLSPWVRAWSKSDSHRSTSLTVSPPTGTEHREYQQSGDADADRPRVALDPDQQAQRRPLLGGPAQQRRHRLRLVGAEALEQPVVGGQRLRPAALALEEVARPRRGGRDPQAHVRVGGAVEAGDHVARDGEALVVALGLCEPLAGPGEGRRASRVVVGVALGHLVVERE